MVEVAQNDTSNSGAKPDRCEHQRDDSIDTAHVVSIHRGALQRRQESS